MTTKIINKALSQIKKLITHKSSNCLKSPVVVGNKPKRVQATYGCDPHLTAGRIYDVAKVLTDIRREDIGWAFEINSDIKTLCVCIEIGCPHLNGNNWIIIETENN